MKALKINWLGACPRCGCYEMNVTSDTDGSSLEVADDVTCYGCGNSGEIGCDDAIAYVAWDDLPPPQRPPHEVRMRNEYADLCEKVGKLSDFIAENPIFASLSARERELMQTQLAGMRTYRDALSERLEQIK